MNVKNGSYFIKLFADRIKRKEGEIKSSKFLYEILDDIQHELHKRGKQQTVNIFNNNTRYIKFLPRIYHQQNEIKLVRMMSTINQYQSDDDNNEYDINVNIDEKLGLLQEEESETSEFYVFNQQKSLHSLHSLDHLYDMKSTHL